MMGFSQFHEAVEQGITVYHGSRTDGLKSIRAGMPPYAGGIGHGVYVGTEIETAQFYGPHVYEMKAYFTWNQVLGIGEDNYNQLDGDTILVSESIPPFQFNVRGKTYAVVDGTGWAQEDNHIVRSKQLEKLMEELGLVYNRQGIPTKTINSWQYVDAILSDLTKMLRFSKMPDVDDFDDHIDGFATNPALAGRIKQELHSFIQQAEAAGEIGELISLEEIGGVVEAAGYKAVHVVGIRERSSVNEEMLVFNERDLKVIKQIS